MEDLLSAYDDNYIKSLSAGDMVEGKIISINKGEIWIDLDHRGTGVLLGKEMEELQSGEPLKIGDSVSASVVEPETSEGYAILSLKKVAKERGWQALIDLKSKSEKIVVRPFDANKGGLLIELEGIRGFLPVSQLSAENYPRVAGGDKEEILFKLNQLIGKPIEAVVIDADKRENKLIFSEKAAKKDLTDSKVAKFKVGDVVKGVVTGVVDFGAFVNIDGVEGLIHISEIAWDRVDNPNKYLKAGQSVEAMIISIDGDKVSLSTRKLQLDPWTDAIKKYKVGDEVEGSVTRITPFGAFVQIDKIIEALVHVSELSDKKLESPEDVIKEGEKRKFKVISIEPESHKIALSLKETDTKTKRPKPKKVTKAAKPE